MLTFEFRNYGSPVRVGRYNVLLVRLPVRVSVLLSVTKCVQSCERNSSCNFSRIFLNFATLQGFFRQGLKMYMTSDSYPQINVCYFFRSLN